MDAFVYQSDLYCAECASQITQGRNALTWPQTMKDDSEYLPQGPYSDGGGEADCPQHCGACGGFLENPLTREGYAYVRDYLERGTGKPESYDQAVLSTWRDFYASDAGMNAA